MISVPPFEELTAKRIIDEVKSIPIYQHYLPDLSNIKRPINKQYLFNVILEVFMSS